MPETVIDPATPTKTRSITIWTPEQARAAAAKSALSRKALAAHRKAAIKQAAQQAATNPFQTITAQPPIVQPPLAPAPDQFAPDRLARIRKQLLKLDRMLAAACEDVDVDATRIDKLASAISRLSEIERQLADRPLPGSRRPAPEKPQSRSSGLLED